MRRVELKDIAEFNPPIPKDLKGMDAEEVAFLPMQAVGEDGSIMPVLRPLGDVRRGYTYFARNDVIVAKISPCLENGKAADLSGLPTEHGFGSTEFHVLRPMAEIDRRYLFHMIWSAQFRSHASASFKGAVGQQRASEAVVGGFSIPLPSLAEQRRIADLLDQADALRRKRRAALDLLDELLRATFLEMFGDPVTNPKGWPIAPIGQGVVDIQYGTADKANEEGNGLPVLRMGNLTYEGHVDLDDRKWCPLPEGQIAQFTVRRGDLLFNRTNSPELVGKTAVWHSDEQWAFAGYLIRARFDPKSLLADYVSGALNSEAGKNLLRARGKPSNNMSNFNATMFQEIELPLPPVERQAVYAERVADIRTSRAHMLEMAKAADALFQSLLHRAFQGQL